MLCGVLWSKHLLLRHKRCMCSLESPKMTPHPVFTCVVPSLFSCMCVCKKDDCIRTFLIFNGGIVCMALDIAFSWKSDLQAFLPVIDMEWCHLFDSFLYLVFRLILIFFVIMKTVVTVVLAYAPLLIIIIFFRTDSQKFGRQDPRVWTVSTSFCLLVPFRKHPPTYSLFGSAWCR